jgi:hypothetical protein
MTSPLLLEDHARSLIHDRLAQARNDALAAELRGTRPSFRASTARVRLADGLRFLARRLDPSIVCEPRLVIARFR